MGLLGLFLTYAAALVLPSGLNITLHTGDALHMISIVERMNRGELPHIDFMTPIGALAFWPIAIFVRFGMSAGEAFLAAHVAVGAVLTGLAVFAAHKRLPAWAVASFALVVMILSVALIHGETRQGVSVSMHYNRWAWAIGFIAVVMSAFKPESFRFADGLLLGAAMAMLAMIKVTYFIALAPVVILGALLTGQGRMLLGGVGTGLCIAALITVVHGLPFWDAYLADLLTVAGSNLRSQPGVDLSEVFVSPPYLGATLVMIAMVLVLRRSGARGEGLILLLLLPAGGYITYQNFGNDPQWLALAAILLAVWAGQVASKARLIVLAGAAACAAFALPSYLNMAASPFRHATIGDAGYTPVLAGGTLHQDVRSSVIKSNRTFASMPLTMIDPIAGFQNPEPMVFMREKLPECRTSPVPAYFAAIARDLEQRGLAQGGRIFAIDVYAPYWLYGDHDPLRGGAPWYYDGLSGMSDASYVLLPACPILPQVRDDIARKMDGVDLRRVIQTDLYTLYTR